MNKYTKQSKLYTTLMYYFLLSVTIAILIYMTVFHVLQRSIEVYAARPNRAETSAALHVEILQKHIDKNKLSRTNAEALALWNDDNWYTSMKVFDPSDPNIVYYDSFQRYQYGMDTSFGLREIPYPSFTYPLRFVDGRTLVTISGPSAEQYGLVFTVTSFVVFLLVFTSCFFLLSRKRFSYIHELQEGIETICAGNLSHALPVTGNDELTSLAVHINDMSQWLQEQLRIEETIRTSNNDVVATISHDLRTPLTSVICYLDLLQDQRYPDEETMRLYIGNARTRAYQIKDMTDELFARSVQKIREDILHWEILSGRELISQILSEMYIILKDSGFTPEFSYTFEHTFYMNADATAFRRIFDNLTSNIIKYANPGFPVTLSAKLTGESLVIIQRNLKSSAPMPSSSGLGLAASRKLVSQHGGDFEIRDNPSLFEIRLTFPAQSDSVSLFGLSQSETFRNC